MNPAPRPRFLAPGDKLGKFDLIRQIAVGGMAEIYLARTLGLEGFEKLVVVKRILPQYVENPSIVNMFLNEARLAATLHHPNITQVYDIGVEDGEYFFSMEYVHGEDLGRLTVTAHEHGVPISLDVALTLGAGLCAGLHYAHEKAGPDGQPLNVVHRDVSPSNVLVSYDGSVKLVDFGIARAGSAPSQTKGGLKGKIAYMSPEQCRGKAVLDRRSDVFSIGTILYELTTGQLPFTDETEYGVLNQIVNDDVPAPSTLVPSYPPALEAILMKALARDPEQRYGTALELQGHLEDFAHDNRLRISPLVLARLMSGLFPARLEEWDHARAQGAFFVEQHVVRTLIESGKAPDQGQVTGQMSATTTDAVPIGTASDEDTTAVTTPIDPTRPTSELPIRAPSGRTSAHANGAPFADAETMPEPPRPGPPAPTVSVGPKLLPLPAPGPPALPFRAPTLTPPAPLSKTPSQPGFGLRPSPVPGSPGAVPIMTPPSTGRLPASPGGEAPTHISQVGERTERVRVPGVRADSPPVAAPERSRLPLILAVAAGVIVIAIVYVLATGSDKHTATPPPTAEVTDKAASDEAATDEAAIDRTAIDKAANDKAAVDKAANDKAAVDKAAIDKAAIAKAANDKAAIDNVTSERPSPDKAAVNKQVAPTTPPHVEPAHVATSAHVEPAHVATPAHVEPTHVATPAHVEPAHVEPVHVATKAVAPRAPRPTPVVIKKPDPKPPEPAKPKEPSWNADSPFMPVRTDKH